MKKILGKALILLTILLITLLQINILNKIYIFGVKINLFVILTTATALWYGLFAGGISGLISGFILDSIYEQSYGKYIILYTAIGCIVGSVNHIYKKENKIALIYVTGITTIIFEFTEMIISTIMAVSIPSLFIIIKILVVSTILNMLASIVVFYVFSYITYKLEEVLDIENRW